MLATIQKLKTILDGIDNSILPLKYEYQETAPTSFPSGNIIFVGTSEKMIDTVTNMVNEQFIVRSIFPAEERQAATEKWMTLMDALTAEFRKDDHQSLTGTAVSFEIRGVSPPKISNEFIQPVIVFDIAVEAKILKFINT